MATHTQSPQSGREGAEWLRALAFAKTRLAARRLSLSRFSAPDSFGLPIFSFCHAIFLRFNSICVITRIFFTAFHFLQPFFLQFFLCHTKEPSPLCKTLRQKFSFAEPATPVAGAAIAPKPSSRVARPPTKEPKQVPRSRSKSENKDKINNSLLLFTKRGAMACLPCPPLKGN